MISKDSILRNLRKTYIIPETLTINPTEEVKEQLKDLLHAEFIIEEDSHEDRKL